MAYDYNPAVPAYIGDDSGFRAWGSAISAQLDAIDLEKTADPQTNWATVPRPTSGAFAAVGEIRKFTDGLADYPIYVKFDWANQASKPQIAITVGTGSDGAGNLTGRISTWFGASTTAGESGETRPSAMSHGEGYLHIATHLAASGATGHVFAIERPRVFTASSDEIDETLLAEGYFVYGGGPSYNKIQVVNTAGTIPSQFDALPVRRPSTNMETSKGNDVAMWSGSYILGARQHSTRLLAYKHADIPELSPVAVSVDGHPNRDYLPLGDGTISPTGESSDALAILAE